MNSIMRLFAVWVAICLATAGVAMGATATVNCPGDSIQAALTILHAVSNRNHIIEINGTCTESVLVDDFENLTLHGNGAVIQEPLPGDSTLSNNGAVFTIANSRNVAIRDLTFEGIADDVNGSELVMVRASRANFANCIFQKSSGDGIFISDMSSVSINGGKIQDNLFRGVIVNGQSALNVQRTSVTNNWDGIWVANSSTASIASGTIMNNNLDIGLRIFGGQASVGFSIGRPAIEISGNGVAGIAINAGSVFLTGTGSPLIRQNKQYGVFLSELAAFRGAPMVENNGTLGCSATDCGGIVSLVNSHVDLLNGTVRNNYGPGVYLGNGSAARIFSNTITGNAAEGVRLSGLSTAIFTDNIAISGNGASDLLCSPNSYGSGNKTGIGKMNCSGFGQEPLPKGGGQGKD